MPSPYAVAHRGVEVLALDPAELWDEIVDVRRFERWWSWLRDLTLEPDRVAEGSVLTFTIVTPLPYTMTCRVEFTRVEVGSSIEGLVTGDLDGWATLVIEPHERGSRVVLEFELEPKHGALRVLVRVARPLILRTKDWAIDVALGAFRRNVEGRG